MIFAPKDRRALMDLQVKKELAQQPLMDLVVRTWGVQMTQGEVHSIVDGLTDNADAFIDALGFLL